LTKRKGQNIAVTHGEGIAGEEMSIYQSDLGENKTKKKKGREVTTLALHLDPAPIELRIEFR